MAGKRLTRDQIMQRKIGQLEVELADGSTVLVRGLTRGEGHKVNQMKDTRAQEVFALSRCMLDPSMSPEEISEWIDRDAGGEFSDFQTIVEAIQKLSLNVKGDQKEATKSVS